MEKVDKYDELLHLLTGEVEVKGKKYLLKEEFEKFFVKGNKASGARVRKVMQDLKVLSQSVRTDVQTMVKDL